MDVIDELKDFYRDWTLEKGYIGFTENGNLIPYFKVKKTAHPVVIAQYAIHAREYITAYLGMMQAKDFAERGKHGTVYFIPAVNIDGIAETQSDKLYKANARGVDLNVNFDADWGRGEKNLRKKASENYIGEKPFSEWETRSLRDFTLLVGPDITVSYHSKGEEIYWEFFQSKSALERDFKIAVAVSAATGYPLRNAGRSAGGYKDWCVQKLGIPALTIEVGNDGLSHPIGKEHAEEIFIRNKSVFKVITEIL
ncbi:MAG: hypothetical protein J5911_00570 [Clostridia bacterium]|nr:hypothetical protein [Clostridia bacterium]